MLHCKCYEYWQLLCTSRSTCITSSALKEGRQKPWPLDLSTCPKAVPPFFCGETPLPYTAFDVPVFPNPTVPSFSVAFPSLSVAVAASSIATLHTSTAVATRSQSVRTSFFVSRLASELVNGFDDVRFRDCEVDFPGFVFCDLRDPTPPMSTPFVSPAPPAAPTPSGRGRFDGLLCVVIVFFVKSFGKSGCGAWSGKVWNGGGARFRDLAGERGLPGAEMPNSDGPPP